MTRSVSTSRSLWLSIQMYTLCGCLLACIPWNALAQPVPVHGSADAFNAPGIALAWGIQRGASEATTQVVIKVAVDAQRYVAMTMTGVDPFTQSRHPPLLAARRGDAFELRLPRSRFAEYPRSDFAFYSSEVALRAGSPSFVVYYLGVPDTTPEFTDEAKLDNYLAGRLSRSLAQKDVPR
jgi:hypothetical protein